MKKIIAGIITGLLAYLVISAVKVDAEQLQPEAEPIENYMLRTPEGWYWYEAGIKQGVEGDPKNIIDEIYGIERGREIFDPESNAWYWLDACYDGKVATDKEAWLPYVFQDADPGSTDGKWVRRTSHDRQHFRL